MMMNCFTEMRVVSKYPKTANNGKTYFHLVCAGLEYGETCDLGCSDEVFKTAIEGKAYKMGFNINPFYLRKDYSCNISIVSLSEAIGINNKKGA